MNRLMKVLSLGGASVILGACDGSARSEATPRASTPAATNEVAPTTAVTPLLPTARGWIIPGSAPQAGWHPSRDGVLVVAKGEPGTPSPVEISYTRDKGTASGAAFMLPAGERATEHLKSLVIHASATPDQRLYVCLTDANGIVWSFPTVRLTQDVSTFELNTADLAPDPFQNADKSPPPAPDMRSMRMLTLLDVSGHMGAPAVPCRWRIERVEGVTQ